MSILNKRLITGRKGLTIAEIFIAIIILGIILSIALPNLLRLGQTVYRDKCRANLQLIKAAKAQWALENDKDPGDACTAADLDPYLQEDVWDEDAGEYMTGHDLVCPADPNGANATLGTSYSINNYGVAPSCNILPDGGNGVDEKPWLNNQSDDHEIR